MIVKKLSEIVDLQKGKKPEISFKSVENLPYLTAKYIRGEADPEYGIPDSEGSVVVSHEDYVIIMDGSNSGEVFTGLNGILASTMGKLVLKEKINMKYLGYFLDFNKELFSKTKTGSAIPHLSKEIFFSLQIPTPPLQEQEKIVKRLDKIHKNINKSVSNDLEKIKSLKNYLSQELNKKFEDLSSFRNTTIGEIFNLANGGTPLKSNKNFYENGKIPFLVTGDFTNKFIDKTAKYITKEGLDNSSAKIFPLSSVVVAMYGATAGKVGILKFECASNQAVCCLYPNDKYDKEFIYYFFLNFKEELVSQATGSAQPNISQKKISNFKFYELDLDKQIKISRQIKTIENLVHNYIEITNTKINKYSSLLKSTLNKEFSYE